MLLLNEAVLEQLSSGLTLLGLVDQAALEEVGKIYRDRIFSAVNY